MNDYILRVTAANGLIRGFFANTKNTVQEAADRHQCTPVCCAALGRLLTVTGMMGLMLKESTDCLTVQFKGDGPGGNLLATANAKGEVKGYIGYPDANVPNKPNGKLDVSGVVGKGILSVTKDMPYGDPYHGTVEIQSGEIAEDIAYYFQQSEQVPSVVSLGVLVAGSKVWQAGGFLLQLMPGAGEEEIELLESKLEGLPSLTNLYSNGETPESLVEYFFKDVGYQILEEVPVKFYCNCSREKVEKALIAIGPEELEAIIKEDHQANVRCFFCNESYDFTESELVSLHDEASKS